MRYRPLFLMMVLALAASTTGCLDRWWPYKKAPTSVVPPFVSEAPIGPDVIAVPVEHVEREDMMGPVPEPAPDANSANF